MMKIKTKKEMTLPQLIDWAWENDVKSEIFYGGYGGEVVFVHDRVCTIDLIKPDETFTIEVEENITEETVIPRLLEVYEFADELDSLIWLNMSIQDALEEDDNEDITFKRFHIINDDGTHILIWKDGKLVE